MQLWAVICVPETIVERITADACGLLGGMRFDRRMVSPLHLLFHGWRLYFVTTCGIMPV